MCGYRHEIIGYKPPSALYLEEDRDILFGRIKKGWNISTTISE